MVTKEDLKIGILYLSLHNLLKKRYGENNTLTRKEFYCEVGKHFLVERKLRICIIIEMEKRKLLKRLDRDTIKINKIDIDLTKDSSKFYELMGLY